MSFEHKIAIFKSYPQLTCKSRSHGRVNFVYSKSRKRAKVLATELHPRGNGYVCGRYMSRYSTDNRGWVNIKHFSESELREVITDAIKSMSN